MNHLQGYTKYQKRVIKFLNEFLGVHTPFYYLKAQNNHLKVLIDGVAKPLYTGSTPSDCKSINNFMAEVKRAVAAGKLEAQNAQQAEADGESTAETNIRHTQSPVIVAEKMKLDKLIDACVKSFRLRLENIKAQELAHLDNDLALSEIPGLRKQIAKESLNHQLQIRRQQEYLKPKQVKALEDQLLKHLNFMLPTLGNYATDRASELADELPFAIKEPALEVTQPLETQSLETAEVEEVSESETSNDKPAERVLKVLEPCVQSFMNTPRQNRISKLRACSKQQLKQLIEDAEIAIQRNETQNIEDVLQMIKQKEVSVEDLINRLTKNS